MKTQRLIHSALLLLAAVLFLPGAAFGQWDKSYLRLEAGPSVSRDTDLEEFFGEPVAGTEVEFDPGLRLGAAWGYQFVPWLSAEAETAWIFNPVDAVAGTGTSDLWLSQIPLLANVVLQYPNRTGLVPFIGAGGGGDWTVIAADRFTLGGTTFDGSDSDLTYAWQAFGGLRYTINERIEVGLMYKYFQSGEPTWEADSSVGGSRDMRFGQLQNHSILAAVNFRF